MLGVDAASIDLVRANLRRLPNFRRLIDRGIYQPLQSWGELTSGAVWPSFATGSSPGEHGIYHHIQWNPARMRLQRVGPDWLGYRPFWQELAAANKKICVVDVPMTFPILGDNALEIVSWASHDRLVPFSCNRPQVERELRRRFSLNPMGDEIPVAKGTAKLQAIRDRLIDSARQKGELTRWLLGLEAWDLLIAVFGETHRGGHLLWAPGGDRSQAGPSADLLEVYAAVDASLGLIVEEVEKLDATVVLFAVHGMTRDVSRTGTVPLVMDHVNRLYQADASPAAGSPGQRSLMRYLRRVLPAPLQHAIGQLVPVGVRDWVVQRATAAGHDWSRTPGLALLADRTGYVRLNLKGREAEGILSRQSPDERRYLAMIEAVFRELADAKTGEAIVAEVLPRSAMFSGARAEFLPDLFVMWRETEGSDRARSDRLGLLPAEPQTGRSGNHTSDGFAVIVSPSRRLTGLPPLNSVTDLARWAHAALHNAA
jgi:predicted AlkP superfamily phosphohydrolase/phosphomutase